MEGPSLVILREELQPFLGKTVLAVEGNTTQPKEKLKGLRLAQIDTWAKVLLLTFSDPSRPRNTVTTKTHFMMFGSYRINQLKENRTPRLHMAFENGDAYFYACSIQFVGSDYLENLDRRVDLMSPEWDERHVLERMDEQKNAYLCDLFLDQKVFAGSGNIVKNEVLFNLRTHPLTRLKDIDKKNWPNIAWVVRTYCFDFYTWKKAYELRRHWQVYRQHYCPVCGRKLVKDNLGRLHRKTFYCEHDQPLRNHVKSLKIHDVLPMRLPQKKPAAQVGDRHSDH